MGRARPPDGRDVPFPGRVLARESWTRTRVGLGPRGARFDWDAVFGRSARRVLDLGCGNGRFLVGSGLARPELDHLGIDLVPPAIRLGSLRAGQRGLTNVKFAWGDATEFLLERCEPGSVDEVHLYHPQPYFDRARIERRQLTPRTLRAIWLALREGGTFVVQTDNPAYWRWAREQAPALFEWRELAGPWPDRPDGRTTREIVARARGLEVFRAEATRRELELAEVERRVAAMPEPDFDAGRAAPGGAELSPGRKDAPRGPARRRARRRGSARPSGGRGTAPA
jgi:tRNA (guanine-N7-)-methyltransferase